MTSLDAGPAARAAEKVDRNRLWQRLMAMARHGARPDGGVNRQAFSAEDAAARRELADWGVALGLGVHVDPVTNLFLCFGGSDPTAAPVVAGSHLDSQPMGGKFDGAFGVLAALEAVEAIAAAGVVTRRPIEVVAWVNEEGSRFAPGLTGSTAFVGAEPLDDLLAWRDPEGTTIGETLPAMRAATPMAAERPLGGTVAAYVEAHIEQGPRLEAADVPIGVVTGIQGMRWYRVEVAGEAAHAGTTPRSARRDALSAAVRIIAGLERLAADPEDVLRFTVGRVEVRPGSPNTVPDRVEFTIDMRHPDAAVLDSVGGRIAQVCDDLAGPCEATVVPLQSNAPTPFPEDMVAAITRAADIAGLAHLALPSGAGHDAKRLAEVCPTGMIFIPCAGGVSHHPSESATPDDVAAGARTLAAVLVDLANR